MNTFIHDKVIDVLILLPERVQNVVLRYMLRLEHVKYGAITSIYWNLADHNSEPEYWWDMQTHYKTSNWD